MVAGTLAHQARSSSLSIGLFNEWSRAKAEETRKRFRPGRSVQGAKAAVGGRDDLVSATLLARKDRDWRVLQLAERVAFGAYAEMSSCRFESKRGKNLHDQSGSGGAG